MIKILVLQTSPDAARLASATLSHLGLVEGVDFLIFSRRSSEIEESVVTGERQLFITGAIKGNIDAALELARTLRAKNSELVTVLYTTTTLPASGPFDRMISKDGLGRNLAAVVLDFQSGKV